MAKNKLFISTAVATVAATSILPIGTDMIAEAATSTFTDVSNSNSHYEAIMDLANRGIIEGYPDGTFAPGKQVTRGQAAKMIAGILNLDMGKGAQSNFSDVSPQNEYAGAIIALKQAGIIDGYEDSTFRPNELIKRNHMAKIITQALQLQGTGAVALPFTDVHSDYKEEISTLYEYGITTGITATTFGGDAFVTRGQLASFIVRAEKAVYAGIEKPSPEVPKVSEKVEVSMTIESIENNKVKMDGQEWTIGANVQALLNEGNATALQGAQIGAILVDGEIAELLSIELNTSGQQGANVTLDGGNTTFAGDITVNADFVELKNMIITKNIVLTARATTYFAMDYIELKGEFIIQEGAPTVTASLTNVLVAADSKPGLTVNSNNSDVPKIVVSRAEDITFGGDMRVAQLIFNILGKLDFTITLGPEVTIVNISGDLTLEQIQTVMDAKPDQILGYTSEDGLTLKFNTPPPNNSDDSANSGSGGSNSGGGTDTGTTKPDLIRLQQAIEQANLDLVEISEDGSDIGTGYQWTTPEVNAKFNEALVEAERVATKVNVTNQEALTAYNKLLAAKGVYDTAKQYGTMVLSTEILSNYILYAKEEYIKLEEELLNGDFVISDNGQDIPQANQWIPRSFYEAYPKVVADAEKMVADAEAGASQKVASLTHMPVLFANAMITQKDLDKMGENLEKLMGGIWPLEGLQEVTAVQKMLEGKEIILASYEMTNLTKIVEEINKLITVPDYSIEEDKLEIDGNQITVKLHDAIEYFNPETFEDTELFPEITAQVKIPFDTSTLESNLEKIRETAVKIEKAAISEDGTDISRDDLWIRQNIKDTFFARIAKGETMLEKAKQNDKTLTQKEINTMSEDLEYLVDFEGFNGLKEAAEAKLLLDGQTITATVTADSATVLASIKELGPNNAVIKDFTKDDVVINDNQITFVLSEVINYYERETGEEIVILPAITAQVTVVPATAMLNQGEVVHTASESAPLQVGANTATGTIGRNLLGNQLRIKFETNVIQSKNTISAILNENNQLTVN